MFVKTYERDDVQNNYAISMLSSEQEKRTHFKPPTPQHCRLRHALDDDVCMLMEENISIGWLENKMRFQVITVNSPSACLLARSLTRLSAALWKHTSICMISVNRNESSIQIRAKKFIDEYNQEWENVLRSYSSDVFSRKHLEQRVSQM